MLRFSAHLGYLFTELPLIERFGAARLAGFTAVEHPAPYELEAGVVRRALEEFGLDFVQFALPAGDASRGEKGFAALPGRGDDFEESLRTGLDYARAIGTPFLQVQSGQASDAVGAAVQWESYLDNLTRAADAAAEVGKSVLIEPIGPATITGYYMSRPDFALRALEEVDRDNVKMLFDIYHSAMADIDPDSFIRAHSARIGHIHIADHPGRNQPGAGGLDFQGLFQTLGEIGFSGWIGCEYKPLGTTGESLAWFQPYRTPPSSFA